MNSRERVEAILEGRLPDYVPIFPKIAFSNTIACEDMNVIDYMTDPKEMARACITAYRKFGWDGVSLHTDIGSEGMALGSEYNRPIDGPSELKTYMLDNLEEYQKIVVPNPKSVEPMKTVIEAVQIVKKEIGNEAYILAWTNGPLNVASQVIRMDTLLIGFIMEPEYVHELLERCLQVSIAYGKALLDAGADAIAYGHATASSTVISKEHYEIFALPYEKRLVKALQEHGGKVVTHICGNIAPIIDLVTENGSDIIDFDHMCDLEELLTHNQKIYRGNIDPALLALGTEEQIEKAVKNLLLSVKGENRLILGSGCEIGLNTPIENLKMLVEAGRKYGKNIL